VSWSSLDGNRRDAVMRYGVALACTALFATSGCAASRVVASSAARSTSTTVASTIALESTTALATIAPVTATTALTTTVAVTATTTLTTAAPPLVVATAPVAADVHRAFPVEGNASYAREHHDYPASDIMANCGLTAVSPVDGTIVHWRTEDRYNAAKDNPALRGGRSVAVLGNDGVRYYMSHFQSLVPDLGVGSEVRAGQPVAVIGRSGDASACHIHFGISPPCAQMEWSVRRGEIWPWPYLDAWRVGDNRSPAEEITEWVKGNKGACELAAADPFANDAG
jgi:peptidoglycan LD-endopeptidase LytH